MKLSHTKKTVPLQLWKQRIANWIRSLVYYIQQWHRYFESGRARNKFASEASKNFLTAIMLKAHLCGALSPSLPFYLHGALLNPWGPPVQGWSVPDLPKHHKVNCQFLYNSNTSTVNTNSKSAITCVYVACKAWSHLSYSMLAYHTRGFCWHQTILLRDGGNGRLEGS